MQNTLTFQGKEDQTIQFGNARSELASVDPFVSLHMGEVLNLGGAESRAFPSFCKRGDEIWEVPPAPSHRRYSQ